MKRIGSPEELQQVQQELARVRDPERPAIAVCAGTGCLACGADDVTEAFRAALARHGLSDKVDVRATGCHGFCERGPLVVIFPKKYFYQHVTPDDVDEIIEKTVQQGEPIERLQYVHPVTGERYIFEEEVPFYKHQRRLIFGDNGRLDPTDIDDYLALGGYAMLARALAEKEPEMLIAKIKDAGLRGRGGGGFSAGLKWQLCREAEGEAKYIICNADEGDPGAYMDRSLLEGNPHLVLEGMILGALAIGACEGVVYVRNEYPLAVQNLDLALGQARKRGLLGENILGSDFSFDIQINRGGGAFVCGEESGLIASVEGFIGEPKQRPPYPSEAGLYGAPTVINNVETWANVPHILRMGPGEYSKIGTAHSKGTKIFSLVGKINNTGLVEVPMGITLRQIIEDIGGGIPQGKTFKAVQTGGPSGGCLPADALDITIDFDALIEAGSMMGSGGMIVMDEETCMVDVARYFLNFLRFESCGKCSICREGLQQLYNLVEGITAGRGTMADLALIERLSEAIRDTSLCALGGTAPNPALSTLRYFRDEYEEHILHHKCRAKVCKPLLTFTIDPEACTGCLICARKCPEGAISGEKKQVHVIDQDKCTQCGICLDSCPDKFDAVRVE